MRTRSIWFAIAILVMNPAAFAQWKQIGPYVGPVTCFATIGSRAFAGCPGGGVLVSTDNGTTWTDMNTGLPDTIVNALAVSGANLLAGTSTGVFLSTDNGAQWTSAISGLYVYSFGVCGSRVYAAAANSEERVFVSTDSGTTWTAANTPFPKFSCMVQLGSAHYAGVDDGTVGGVYLSSNSGATWTQSGNGLAGRYVTALAVSDTIMFAGTEGGVFRSTDQGTSWTVADTGLKNTNVRALAVSGASLFAGTDGGILFSKNSGITWQAENCGLMSGAIFALSVSGANIFAGTTVGISVSTDNGLSWNIRSPGRNPYVAITALAVRGPELFVAAAWGGGSKSILPVETFVFHSTDNGESWVPLISAEADAIIIQDADVFVGSGNGSWLGKGVLRSSDHGTTWMPVNAGFPKATAYGDTSGYAHVTCFASSGQVLFAGTYGSGVYSTTNDGVSWNPASNGLTNVVVRALAISGEYLFAATDSGVFRSTNNGTSWSASNEGFPPPAPPGYSPAWGVNSFVTMGTSLFAGGWHSWERGIVFRSTDHGTYWTIAETDFARQVSGMGVSSTNLFAGTWCCDSLYLSTDGGARWRSVGPTPGYSGVPLATNDKYVFWGSGSWGMWGPSGSGLFRRPLSEMITSVGPPSNLMPQDFLLHQNYPNPFNPSTTILYELPLTSKIRLTVFDMLGREVAVLVDEKRAPGTYQISFDGSGLSSGVYFYRIHVRPLDVAGGAKGELTQTKRLMLLK